MVSTLTGGVGKGTEKAAGSAEGGRLREEERRFLTAGWGAVRGAVRFGVR